MKNNYLRKLMLLGISLFGLNAVAQYTVSAIPHQAYAPGLSVAFTQDDTFSPLIPLTFDFDYFGNTYNQVVVSTNGYISFESTNANGFSPWSFNTTIPNTAFPVKTSFLGCYHDINNADGGGTVTYSIQGTAPYRKFIVIYDNN